MKKLTLRYKNYLIYKIKKTAKRPQAKYQRSGRSPRHVVTIWQGGDQQKALCLRRPTRPPRIMCLEENYDETSNFFDILRNIKLSVDQNSSFIHLPKNPKKLPRITGYVDISQIKYISPAAITMLGAEYQRASEIMLDQPCTIDLHKWDIGVFSRLYELGFFEIVGLSDDNVEKFRRYGNSLSMRLTSGTNASEVQKIDQRILELAEFANDGQPLSDEISIPLITGIGEALTNVSKHAYSDPTVLPRDHVKKWWFSGISNKKSRTITVVLYDQGVTIPYTYSKRSIPQVARDFLANRISKNPNHKFENDASFIEAAMRYGASQTGEAHRGKGLPQMAQLIDTIGTGRLTIWSRGGWCRHKPGSSLERVSRSEPINGTLIQWSLILS